MRAAGRAGKTLHAALLCGLALSLLTTLASLGCATATGGPDAAHPSDPWEKMNRGIFAFNEGADAWVVEPSAKAWNFVLPEAVQRSLKNIFDNAWMPAVFGNHILQAHPKMAFAEDLPRLLVNTTVGLGGIFDVATQLGIEDNYADFGLTMGRWGLPPGPYFVIPLLGPSSVRDGTGRVADAFSSPYSYFVPWWSFFLIRGGELLNLRSLYLEEVTQSRADAFDYYLFVRDAWMQNRRYQVMKARGQLTPESSLGEDPNDLYFFDEEDDSEADGADES